nr:hypothetical protein CFP56_51360 [Quercus suber]
MTPKKKRVANSNRDEPIVHLRRSTKARVDTEVEVTQNVIDNERHRVTRIDPLDDAVASLLDKLTHASSRSVVKSAYKIALEKMQETDVGGSVSDGGTMHAYWKKLWKFQVPNKIISKNKGRLHRCSLALVVSPTGKFCLRLVARAALLSTAASSSNAVETLIRLSIQDY